MIKNTFVIAVMIVLEAFSLNRQEIPRLYFQGDISGMEDKSDVRTVEFAYEEGDLTFSGWAELKIQGNSSLAYDKKNYNIKLFSDRELEDKLKLDLGWGAQNKYCLKANWVDRTHSRNVVSARLVGQMQEKYGVLTQAPNYGCIDGFPVEIYVNGEFHGLYTLNIPKDEWTFAMDGDDPDQTVLQSEGWDQANKFLAMPDFESWSVEVGEESGETLDKARRLFDFVMNSTDVQFTARAHEYLDLDAALNYYVFTDFACLGDNTGKNMLLATYDGAVWYPILYDLEGSWGVQSNGGIREYETITMSNNRLFQRLEECFPVELGNRYFQLRLEILNKAHILEEFGRFYHSIPGGTFFLERKKWGLSIPGQELGQIGEYLDEMIPVLDEKYLALALGE